MVAWVVRAGPAVPANRAVSYKPFAPATALPVVFSAGGASFTTITVYLTFTAITYVLIRAARPTPGAPPLPGAAPTTPPDPPAPAGAARAVSPARVDPEGCSARPRAAEVRRVWAVRPGRVVRAEPPAPEVPVVPEP
ncbi:hypothetical protein MSIMFI_03030 [Mycobacterium simulans]|nr:hypothetical protein MSIMFI_03030 [Mycobacterium simulans]